MSEKKPGRYLQIIETIFRERYRRGMREFEFEREDIGRVAKKLKIELPKNIGDILYTFRYRGQFPESIRDKAPEGEVWVIRAAGPGRYRFALTKLAIIKPNPSLIETKIPDSTPGLIEKYALDDEQALLAKMRYNRLVDVFTGVTCYSLQSHLRTHVTALGQVETDEVYVGVDRRGAHYVFPVQVKGGADQLSIIQIEQDIAMCARRFSGLICRPIAGQFMGNDLIALFELAEIGGGVAIATEKHYRLVPSNQLSPEELRAYAAITES